MSAGHDDRSNRLYQTNDYSIVSKYSAAKLGYFDDPILVRLSEERLGIKKKTRRTPLVNIGYANRVLVVDHKVTKLIKSDEVDCIIVLGCGFDTLAARHINSGCNWIEIDLTKVIKAKSWILSLEWGLPMIQAGSDPDVITFKDKPIHLISCDIRFQSELSSKLSKVLSFLQSIKRVVILNEVCLNYLETNEVQQVIETIEACIKERASTLTYLGFEQVRPSRDNPFTKIMIDHFESISHPLKHLQTRSNLADSFINRLEFDHLDIESLYKLYRIQDRLKSGNLDFHFDREPFDEFEELDMYMAHYAVVEAQKTFSKTYDNRSKGRRSERSDNSTINATYKINSHCICEETEDYIRRYAHSVCILKDTADEQSVLISGGFGVAHEGEQHRRLQECMMMTRNSNRCGTRSRAWQAQPLSKTFENPSLSMHGQTCCVDPVEKIIFFCCGRGSPHPNGEPIHSFVAKVTSDYQLKHVHSFKENTFYERLATNKEDKPGSWRGAKTNWWRHTIVKRSDGVIQLGGLPALSLDWKPDMNMVSYQLHADRLGAIAGSLKSVEPRHSFGADMRWDHTLLVYGGLRVERALNYPGSFARRPSSEWGAIVSWDKSFVPCDRDIRPAQDSILYDFRLDRVVQRADERGSSSYGMQVHFVNENQFVRVGGISTVTGFAEQSIDLFDLRRLDQGPVVKTPVESKQNDLLLCNAASVKFESSKEIVTFGGGGTCFTFGTHFNRSQLIYNYAQFPTGSE